MKELEFLEEQGVSSALIKRWRTFGRRIRWTKRQSTEYPHRPCLFTEEKFWKWRLRGS